jgi:hypothetical protein
MHVLFRCTWSSCQAALPGRAVQRINGQLDSRAPSARFFCLVFSLCILPEFVLYFYCSILPVGFGFAADIVPCSGRRVRQPSIARRLANPVYLSHSLNYSFHPGIFCIYTARAILNLRVFNRQTHASAYESTTKNAF